MSKGSTQKAYHVNSVEAMSVVGSIKLLTEV